MSQAFRGRPAGLYVTWVVDDAKAVYEKAVRRNHEVVQEPQPTSYGRLRVLLEDPGGLLVDVSSPEAD